MNKIELTNEQLIKIVGGIVLTAAFFYAYAFFFWIPVSKTIAGNSAKSAAMEGDIAAAKAQKAAYPDLEAKLTQLKEDKEEVKQMLPGERQFPDLIKTIMQLGAKYKVNIQNIAPSGSTNGEYFIKTSYKINASGNYHAIGRFLTALGLEVRIMTVSDLVLGGTPDAPTGSATASFTLVTYQYNDKTRPSSAPAKSARNK